MINNKKFILKTIVIVLFLISISYAIFIMPNDNDSSNNGNSTTLSKPDIIIYKDPNCGCCSVYASYMKKRDYGVEVDQSQDMDLLKEEYEIPRSLWSCHTTIVEGYYVEGHIPEEVVEKLLIEKPDIAGIGMPGMPSGSPGMPGPKNEDFVITAVNHDGSTYEYMRI